MELDSYANILKAPHRIIKTGINLAIYKIKRISLMPLYNIALHIPNNTRGVLSLNEEIKDST